MCLQFLNVYRAGSLVSLFDVETDALAFMQRPESRTLNRAVVDKYVSSLVTLDKTEPLFLIEPFHLAFCQNFFPLSFNVSLLKQKKPPQLIPISRWTWLTIH